MIPLSFSAMADLQCPYRFRILRVDKSFREPETDGLRVGSAVAAILAEYRRHCYREGVSSDLSFLEGKETVLEPDIKERVADLLAGFASTEFATVPLDAEWVHVESLPVDAREGIGGFAFDGALRFLGCDKAAWLQPEAAFRLKADFCYYLGGELHIVDDKSGWGDGDEQQLATYAHLVKLAWTQVPANASRPLERILCTFNNIAKRTTTRLAFSPEDTDPIGGVLLEAMREVNERKDWPAVACLRCKHCSVPDCPVRENAAKAIVTLADSPVSRVPSEINCLQEAETALLFIQFAEAVTDRVKDVLRAWVERNGPVMAGGKVARFGDKESWKVTDLKSLCECLVALGAPKELIWKELSMTKTAVEKVIKKAKLEAKRAWIDAYIEKRTSSSFGIVNDKIF